VPASAVAGRPTRRSRLASALNDAGCSPTLVTGVRMAVEPGRGGTAVPVRTSIVGVMLGVAVLAGTLTFGASLTHLLDSPRLYGVTWDLQVSNFNEGTDLTRDGIPLLRRQPGVRAIAFGGLGALGVRGQQVDMVAIGAIKGECARRSSKAGIPRRDEIVLGLRGAADARERDRGHDPRSGPERRPGAFGSWAGHPSLRGEALASATVRS
jgi:hypothetical protein